MNEELNLEDIIIERISVQELVKKFQPEIQEILYNSYGAKLESLPERLNSKTEMEDMLELLLELKDVKSQKIILMRYGIATGLLMSLEEVANELMSVTRNNEITLSAAMIFSPYPQAYFPQLCITAIAVPGTEIGSLGDAGERFLDNQRIEGSIPEMLDEAIRFVKKNMKNKTIINPETGAREDRTDYPVTAVREAIINALVHRDYSIHTEGMPIQIIMYDDRMEIKNPGGIYGRIKVDQLGKMQPDTRNPVLALALETLGVTESRYSGIPTIRREMEKFHLREPGFADERGSFSVTFYKADNSSKAERELEDANNLLQFCRTPRTRKEICEYLKLSSVTYAIQTYVMPLVESGKIKMTNPEKPKSSKQLFYSE